MKDQTKKHSDFVAETLQDPKEVEAYLNAALDDAFEQNELRLFLMALRDVATARDMKTVAAQANLNRESLYRSLSEKGNPELSSLCAVLKTVGLKLGVRA